MHGEFLFILVILVPFGVLIFMWIKKKNPKYNTTPTKQRKDEVWRSIKYFLKQNNEQGKEIIDSYVAKRKNPDFAMWKKENKATWDAMTSKEKKDKRENFKKDPAELYVVLFTTRDSKTKKEDAPRAIECQIIYSRTTNKRDKEARNIVINGQLDYKTESEWIDPLRKRDEIKLIKEEEKQAKREQKKVEKLKKKTEKQREKSDYLAANQ